jgi:hypothetical protein
MKTCSILTVLITALIIGNLPPATAQEMSKQDYLEKSRRQKTAGFIMLGGGVVMATSGIVLFSENFVLFGASEAEDRALGVGAAMFVVGGLAAIGSIPVFISSSMNAKRAAQLSFNHLPTNIPKYSGNIPRSIPSITFSVPLN